MDFHPQIQVNVPPPPSPSQTHKFRPLSADEALQFTPFTTPILPAHDRIPVPQIARVRETGPVASQLEKKSAQQFSGRAQNGAVKDRLGALLTADSLNEYKFILPPTRSRSSNGASQPKPTDLGLSPLALAVYNMASVDYRYPSPPESISTADSVDKAQIRHLKTPITPAPTISPEPKIQSSTTSSFPQSKSFKSPASKPLVQIPKPASNFRRDDYAAAPDSPKRRKLSHDDQDESLRRSHLQVQQHALSELSDILTEVFDANDAITTAGAHASTFFDIGDDEDESLPHLSLPILDKLQSHLKKVVGFNRLADIPQDHLRRLQQLCEPSVERARSLNLRLSPDASEDDRSDWRTNVCKAQNGVAASIAFLYTMIGCPHEEALLTSDAHPYIPAVLTNVFESCIIPVVEVRPDDAGSSELFSAASSFKDEIRRLVDLSRKLLDLIATACVDVKGSEIFVHTVEFLAAKLIFLQNAPSEKSSALGLQACEKLRKSAMSVLARLYTRFPQERSAILDEVLTSLDKLQSSKRNAQHHRLADGNNIQLITVLFMQLVQTTSIETGRSSKTDAARPKKKIATDGNAEEDDEEEDEDTALDAAYSSPFLRLQDKVDKLFNPAAKSAQDIVAWLVSRASNTTKTGDSPYRTILDNFVKDLILALPDMEWPAAEMLLRVLAARMLDIVANDKSASAKNMALEQLGEMGAAISKLRISASVLKVRPPVEDSDDCESSNFLRTCIESQAQSGAVPADDLISLRGPFAIVLDHLFDAASSTNLSRQSACSYFLAHYAKLITLTASSDAIDGSKISGLIEEILGMLSDSVSHPQLNHSFSDDEVRHAYLLCVLNLGFCRRLHEMIRVQIEYARIEQPQLRARSIKSLQRILEADPSPIERDGQLVDVIFQRANDESGLVRDAALSILANLMVPREALRRKAIKRLLECAEDSKVGVTKRAIGYLKDIYFNDDDPVLKALIARKVLQRFNDHEDSIANTAKQTLQDIWLTPTMKILHKDDTSAESVVAIEGLAEHLIKCVTVSAGDLSTLLKAFFVYALRKESRAETSITILCTKLTDVFFGKTIAGDNNQAVLDLLTAMSEADPKLVKPQQLSKLQNYLSDIKTENDLFMFRSVVRIFINVLPDISKTHEDMLRKIQNALMNAVGKLGRRTELDMVMKCLRTIDTVLRNTERLVRLTVSCVDQLPRPNINVPSLQKLLRILGAVGKYIDFDERPQLFVDKLKATKAHSVAGYIAAAVHKLTTADRPFEVRLTAFETLGAICQAAPAEFTHAQVKQTFFQPLMQAPREQTTDAAALRTIVLRILEELYTARAQEKDKSEKSAESGEKQELKQMGGSSRTRDHDSAISSITPEIVDHALRIALADTSDDALLATKMLSSISHQGLVHPKQILGAFVALGTSQRTEIAEVSHAAQALLHEQHESHCEREYMSAVVQAFEYQTTVADDPTGANQPGNRAKLSRCFEIVATSSSKYIKKFLSGLVSRGTIDFSDIQQMIVALDKPLLTRFIVQNIAFADYKKVDELLHVTLQLELAYGKGGTELAAAIEASQQAHPDIAVASEVLMNGDTEPMAAIEVSKTRDPALVLDMKRFGPAAANLMLLIEARAHLIRQYALARDIRATLTNNKKEKTGDKAPSKTIGITGERFWKKSNDIIAALESEEATIKLCEEFVAAVNIDDDLDNFMFDETDPSAEAQDFANYAKASTPGGRKRKLAANSGGTPSKRPKGRPRKSETGRSASISSRDDPDDEYEE